MSAIAQASLTAFEPTMMQPRTAQPETMGRDLLEGLDHFNTSATQFQTAVQQAVGLSPSDVLSNALGGPQESVTAKQGLSAKDAFQQGAALQQKSMGLMMQTYSFALEATLVTNAATTFTSSINTLIKTQ